MSDDKHEKLTEMVEAFCREYLNDDYKRLCLKLIEKMAERKSVPYERGKLEVWASAVIYAVSQINSLFDGENENHITRKDITSYFKTKQSIVSQKAINLRNIFNIDSELTLYGDDSDFDDNIMIDADSLSIEEYQRAIDEYKRRLGKKFFEENEGEFWLIEETRPFMQCLFEQADLLWMSGEKKRAIDQYKYMLKLNPNDNQGVRDTLFPNLLELNRLDEAKELYFKYENDFTANWKFNKLLLDIKSNASFDDIKIEYEMCVDSNPYVVPYLLGKKILPKDLPLYYQLGDENEAIIYAVLATDAWESDPKAMKILKKLAKNS